MQLDTAPVPAGGPTTHQLLLGQPVKLIQVAISARCGQHFGICSEYLGSQLVHKSYVTQQNSSLS